MCRHDPWHLSLRACQLLRAVRHHSSLNLLREVDDQGLHLQILDQVLLYQAQTEPITGSESTLSYMLQDMDILEVNTTKNFDLRKTQMTRANMILKSTSEQSVFPVKRRNTLLNILLMGDHIIHSVVQHQVHIQILDFRVVMTPQRGHQIM